MVFSTSDTYTTSGSVKLWNKRTAFVTKYDASSFYNWEVDNLPLYDLEEQVYENWEQLGFPASSVPGLALVVSGGNTMEDTPTQNDLDLNPNLFTSLSGALDAMPKVLRFPVIIEVASFGDLGGVRLNGLQMIEDGSLEIINRNFAKVYGGQDNKADVSAIANALDTTDDSENGLVTQLSSLYLSSMLNASAAAWIVTGKP